ncbi:MAG TPA: hypothetical protein VF006_33730, partial [Longimicrobium sp.]
GVMKPKPLLSLNHLTVPLVRIPRSLYCYRLSGVRGIRTHDRGCSAGFRAPAFGAAKKQKDPDSFAAQVL